MEIPDPQSNAAIDDLFRFLDGWRERHGIKSSLEESYLMACLLAGRLGAQLSLQKVKELPPTYGEVDDN